MLEGNRSVLQFHTEDVDAGLPDQEDVMLKRQEFAKPADCLCHVTVAAKTRAPCPSASTRTVCCQDGLLLWMVPAELLLPDQFALEANLLAVC